MPKAEEIEAEPTRRKSKEEKLYEPVKNALQKEFERYLASERERTGVLSIGKVHLEITAKGHFSEDLKEVLDDSALSIIRVEKFSPDIMGFIQKNRTFQRTHNCRSESR